MADDDAVAIIRCTTSAGPFAAQLNRRWSPHGYDRAVELFEKGFFDDSHLFRAVKNFLVQFGISYTDDPYLKELSHKTIADDPQLDPPIKFKEGIMSFAGSGPNSRTTHLFVAYGAIPSLGTQLWETPIGEVIEGMENVRSFYSGYGDGAPHGKGPAQHMIHSGGRSYMEENFPLLDKFISCTAARYSTAAEAAAAMAGATEQVKHPRGPAQRELRSANTLGSENGGSQWTVENERLAMMASALIVFVAIICICAFGRGEKSQSKKQ